MPVTPTVRTWHKWLAVVVGLQLLAWTCGGLVFSWHPIEVVRGETLVREPASPPLPPDDGLVSLARARAALAAAGRAEAWTSAALVVSRDRWTWRLDDGSDVPPGIVDAHTGAVPPPVDADEARAIAAGRFLPDGDVVDVQRVEALGGEYRERPVPAWRVSFDDADATNVYVDATTGAITAVRSDVWRRFDWFWMLHIMDYDKRKDFSHPLLTSAAALGVATSITGVWLAVLLLWPRRR